MKIAQILTCLLATLLLVEPAAGTGGVNEGQWYFEKHIKKAFASTELPGLVAGIIDSQGDTFVHAVGYADLEAETPLTVNHRFHVGSVTQSMLAAILFSLEEEAKLSLDDPLCDYVDFPGAEAVTLKMLLDHSTGFGDWTIRDLAATDNEWLPDYLTKPRTLDELLDLARKRDPAFPPGERQEASYTNMLLMSAVIEKVEGKPAQNVLEERIFRPLGLENTFYAEPGETGLGIATGYRRESGWSEPVKDGFTDVSWADDSLRPTPDQGLISTAGDLLKYHRALREGRICSAESFKRMSTRPEGRINGLGYIVVSGARGSWQGANGHAVGHLTCMYYHVEKDFYVVMMANLGDTGLPLAKLYDLMFPEEEK